VLAGRRVIGNFPVPKSAIFGVNLGRFLPENTEKVAKSSKTVSPLFRH
jgi:hypothetical protein